MTTVSANFADQVEAAMTQARTAAERAAADYQAGAAKTPEGFIRDAAGFAGLEVVRPSDRLRKALSALGAAISTRSGVITLKTWWATPSDQSITLAEKAAEAARASLTASLPASDGMWTVASRLD